MHLADHRLYDGKASRPTLTLAAAG